MQQISYDSGILAYFHGANSFSGEAKVFGSIINKLVAEGRHVGKRSLILKLIEKLEVTSDVVGPDLCRQILDVIVSNTPSYA